MLRLCFLLVLAIAANADVRLQCLKGVDFWCQNEATAKACFKEDFCRSTVWFSKDQKICKDCRAFLEDIKDLLIGPKMEEAAVGKMKELCSQLPAQVAVKYCEDVTLDWIQHVFDFLTTQLRFNIMCDQLHLCGESSALQAHDVNTLMKFQALSKYIKTAMMGQNNGACQTCKDILDRIKLGLGNRDLQNTVEQTVGMAVCTLMPPSMVSRCKQQIEFVGTLTFDFILSINSETVCEILRLCYDPNVHPATPILYNVMDRLVGKIKDMSKPLTTEFIAMSKSGPTENSNHDNVGNTECKICMMIMGQFEHYLNNKNSQDQVLGMMARTCGLLPEPLGSECQNFVQHHGRNLLKLLLEMLPPDMVCASIGLCDDCDKEKMVTVHKDLLTLIKRGTSDKAASNKVNDGPERLGESLLCTLCQQVTGFIIRTLGSQQLNDGLAFVYRQLCALFPSPIRSACDDLVQRVIDAVLGGLASASSDPLTLCAMIGTCDASILTPKHYNVTHLRKEHVLLYQPKN